MIVNFVGMACLGVVCFLGCFFVVRIHIFFFLSPTRVFQKKQKAKKKKNQLLHPTLFWAIKRPNQTKKNNNTCAYQSHLSITFSLIDINVMKRCLVADYYYYQTKPKNNNNNTHVALARINQSHLSIIFSLTDINVMKRCLVEDYYYYQTKPKNNNNNTHVALARINQSHLSITYSLTDINVMKHGAWLRIIIIIKPNQKTTTTTHTSHLRVSITFINYIFTH
jgi:hypothetical protein